MIIFKVKIKSNKTNYKIILVLQNNIQKKEELVNFIK